MANIAYVSGFDMATFCVIGEYIKGHECVECPPKSYSIIEKDATSCKPCPE